MMGASTLLHHSPVEEEEAFEKEDQMQQQEASSQSWEIPELPADPSFVNGVASRDVIVNESRSVWLRLFLPESAVEVAAQKKLPIVVHVHGGGFVRFSAATASYHDFCKKVAIDATVLVVSLNHRLAPEHRLPAAYEDLLEALAWLQSQAESSPKTSDPWLASHADFSNVIFMGGSSGGNIVHHTLLGVKCTDFGPLKFTGQVLLQPFFGGTERTKSELRLSEGPILTLSMSDQLWKLALPVGADRQHPFCNPLAGLLGEVCGSLEVPKALVVVGGRDMLRDRQVEFAEALRKAGGEVKLVEYPEATHGFVSSEGVVSYVFMDEVLGFIRSCGEQG